MEDNGDQYFLVQTMTACRMAGRDYSVHTMPGSAGRQGFGT